MKLRTIGFIATLALGILLAPLAPEAQKVGKIPRIGLLTLVHADSQRAQYLLEVFRQGLRELGWVEGQNISIEYAWAEEKAERLPALAAELVLSVPVAEQDRALITVIAHTTSPRGSRFEAEVMARRASLEREMARLDEQQRLLEQVELETASLVEYCQRVRETR